MNNTPGNIGALEDYQCISISPGFSIGQNQSILIVWNGYQDITSIDCDKFFLDQHFLAYRIQLMCRYIICG